MAYPATLDVLTDPAGSAMMNDPALLHSVVEKKQNDAIEAVQTALGLNPQGGSLTVAARLTAIESSVTGKLDASQKAAASGVASLDASSMLVQNVDAGKMTSGTLVLARIPLLPASKIDTAGGAFNVAQIPNLDAAKTTTGVFATARIPGLNASWITAGTIDAARLPSSVTSNANSKVVADVAARDAILLADRVDGMIVTVRNPYTQYTWRADSSVWRQTGQPGAIDEPPTEDAEGTDLTTGTTTFAAGAPGLSKVFTAPQSGMVYITASAHMVIATGTGNGYFAPEVRTGAVVGSGSVIRAANTDEGVAVGGVLNARANSSSRILQTGLTPGSQYHVRTMFLVTAGTLTIFYRRLLVEAVH